LAAANPRLTPADPKARTQCVEGPGPDGKDPRLTNPMLNRLVTCQNVTMGQFGILLQSLGYYESIYTPVADDTGLKGSYSFTLSFTGGGLNRPWGGPRTSATEGPAQASDPVDTVSLASALKNQLGLKLEKEKRPLPVLVIDHIEEPTAN
ncbi:MAG TPA: TIGR03435 family protein, partial [Thermoanaerobaculia bacterium]